MPYYDAYYHSATGKIYATLENYIVQCSATTGKKESSAKVGAPLLGPMRITGDATSLYVSGFNDQSLNKDSVAPYPTTNKQIFTVNPSTLAISNTLEVDDTVQAYFGGSLDTSYPHMGPLCMKVLSGYMYFVYGLQSGGWQMYRVNITNAADNDILVGANPNDTYQYPEQFDMATILGTDYLWIPQAQTPSLWVGHIGPLFAGSYFYKDFGPVIGANYPTACVYVPSKDYVYAVCGSDTMLRWDQGAGAITTSVDLGTVITGGKPCRLRLSPLDSPAHKLYIPCQGEDTIIIWDTATETGTYKTGFDSPIDIVFTDSKAFAVQTGVVGLAEIL